MLRTDRAVVPTMMKGGTVSLGELEQLRRIENVVRLGHVERIEPDGSSSSRARSRPRPIISTCTARRPGLSDNPPRAIFTDDTITLQLVTRVSLTLSGALQGFLETHGTGRRRRRTGSARRPSCRTRRSTTCACVMAGIRTEMGWQEAPDLQEWRRSLAAQPHERLGRERPTAQRSESCKAASSGRCFPRSTSCRCSRHRPRHGNARGCSNPRRVPTTDVAPSRQCAALEKVAKWNAGVTDSYQIGGRRGAPPQLRGSRHHVPARTGGCDDDLGRVRRSRDRGERRGRCRCRARGHRRGPRAARAREAGHRGGIDRHVRWDHLDAEQPLDACRRRRRLARGRPGVPRGRRR